MSAVTTIKKVRRYSSGNSSREEIQPQARPTSMNSILRIVMTAMFAASVWASDHVGIYAKVDKVVLEPANGPAQRVQVWGVFATAKPENGNDYASPQRGYLYFQLPANAEAARKEWADMQRLAGKGDVVAFSVRWNLRATVRKADQKPEDPETYSVNTGVVPMGQRADYAPVKAILAFK